jgi:hypothetical protein
MCGWLRVFASGRTSLLRAMSAAKHAPLHPLIFGRRILSRAACTAFAVSVALYGLSGFVRTGEARRI